MPTASIAIPTLAQDLYEAFRDELAAQKGFDRRYLTTTKHWTELTVPEKHIWKGVVERFERNLAESAAEILR